MKQIAFLLMALVGTLTAMADSYPYLTFQTTDGSTGTLAVEDLKLTISDGTLTATNAVTGQTFALSDLSKMFFANRQSVTIPSNGWASFYSDCTFDLSSLSSELTAYTATFSGETATLTTVSQVPALTGFILEGTAGTYELPVSAAVVDAVTGNELSGTLTDMTVDAGGYYALKQLSDTSVGFAAVTSGVTIPAGKAYYVNSDAAVSAFYIQTDETGIEVIGDSPASQSLSDTLYDLQGRQFQPSAASRLPKGVYIRGGKKYIFK
ncbi:MAG: hypothetical protein IJT75_06575 [Bacteroidaceae bacterium]|nr:hypothetical protein [Bacteroidaceae bacterium]